MTFNSVLVNRQCSLPLINSSSLSVNEYYKYFFLVLKFTPFDINIRVIQNKDYLFTLYIYNFQASAQVISIYPQSFFGTPNASQTALEASTILSAHGGW